MTIDRVTLQLLAMRESAVDPLGYTQHLSKPDFLANGMVQKAVGMCFILIGEAAAELMRSQAKFVTETPQLEWSKMRGMRNVVAHGYDTLDHAEVWDIVKYSLPELLGQLALILPTRSFDGIDADA